MGFSENRKNELLKGAMRGAREIEKQIGTRIPKCPKCGWPLSREILEEDDDGVFKYGKRFCPRCVFGRMAGK